YHCDTRWDERKTAAVFAENNSDGRDQAPVGRVTGRSAALVTRAPGLPIRDRCLIVAVFRIKRVRLVGILLLVFAKRDTYGDIPQTTVYTQTCPTGLLNRMGNKGGVAVSLRIHDTKICFVNSHLAAGSNELSRRNQDFREISRIAFSGPGRPTIFDHDVLVWLGDLNYRLESLEGRHLDNSEVRRVCANGECAQLLKFDQLVRMQKAKTAFHDFMEGDISFPPTYKYDPGTDNWDSSEKARVPAWCDRILWMSRSAAVKQLQYRSVREVKISDHKPVVALFSVTVKKIDQTAYRKVHEEAIREGDRRANEALPAVEMDRSEFNFGQVKFLEPKVLSLVIRNTGKYPVYFKFGKHAQEEGEFGVSK
uniref:Inositol polyphosphate-related phosphatase domain-containing protein n=1 Tax=Plectus sambesii TaxID=2011161 RepID=A0A914UWS9_9BILA